MSAPQTMPMTNSGLQYFTHQVDGALYGAWYRVVAWNEIEVISVGILETAKFAGFSPMNAAQSILENSVRQNSRLGTPVPSLAEVASSEPQGEDAADPPPFAADDNDSPIAPRT
jgi:hypothetical protein